MSDEKCIHDWRIFREEESYVWKCKECGLKDYETRSIIKEINGIKKQRENKKKD